MQLLLSSPYIFIEKNNLKEYLSTNTFNTVDDNFYSCPLIKP